MSLSPKGHTIQIGRIVRSVECIVTHHLTPGTRVVPATDDPFERGRKQGREEALREMAPTAAALQQMLAALQRESREMTQAIDRSTTRLALRIAAKIIDREVTHADTAAQMISSALAQVPLNGQLTIRLNPADAENLELLRGKSADGRPALPEDAILIADPSIQRGGCTIQGRSGCLDARISTQLAQIDQALRPPKDREAGDV